MKNNVLTFIALLMCCIVKPQNVKETHQELSKKASKGLLNYSFIDDNSNLVFTYKMKVDKKSDVVSYEDYVFDSDLNFKGSTTERKQKEHHENIKTTTLTAFVGGNNSFNALSMKLTLQKEVWERNWDYELQKYIWGKRLSKEVVKPRNSEGKYKGYAAYPDDENGSIFIIAAAETDDKDINEQYVGLFINQSLDLKEIPFSLKGNYSLVYCGELKSGNVFSIFAPNKSAVNPSSYVYLEISKKGNLIYHTEFTAPAAALAVMDYQEADGKLILLTGSVKKATSYDTEFSSYAPIYNPGYLTSTNALMDKYEKKIYKQEFESVHLLKFEKGNLLVTGTTPVKQFNIKIKTPPSQKKATPYEGKKLAIQDFVITPNGDCLVTGQLKDKKIVNGGQDIQYFFYDIVCLHFDNGGNLKAQYAVEKMNDDKKSEMFQSQQRFFMGSDGKTVYWEILEVKGTKGYNSFMDAYSGNMTFIANYFPRIAKIDIQNTTVSDFNVLGDHGKYLLYKQHSFLFNESTRTRYYIGHDKEYENIWIGKTIFE